MMAEGFKRCRDSTRKRRAYAHARTHTRTYMYVRHPVYAYARDCIYAESYLPRLKSHRGESRGRSALGIASARVVIPPRCASLPFMPSSPPFSYPTSAPVALSAMVHRRRRMQMHR